MLCARRPLFLIRFALPVLLGTTALAQSRTQRTFIRASCLLVLLAAICGCGGGGSAGQDDGPQQLSFGEVFPGQVAGVPVVTRIPIGATWEVAWVDVSLPEGLPAATSDAQAISVGVISLDVPEALQPGQYEVSMTRNGTIEYSAYMNVLEPPVIDDPAAYVSSFQGDIEAVMNELAGGVATEPDPELRAAMQADLERLADASARMQAELASATPEDVAALAYYISLQRPDEDVGQQEGGSFDPSSAASSASLSLERAAFKYAQGVVAVVGSVAAFAAGNVLIGSAALALGISLWLEGNSIVSDVLGRPVALLEVFLAIVSTDSTQEAGACAAGGLVELEATGSWATLSQSLSGSELLDVRRSVGVLSAIQASWNSLPVAARAIINTPPPRIPDDSNIQQHSVPMASVQLVGSSNPRVTMFLEDRFLMFETSSLIPEVSTATLRIPIGVGSNGGLVARIFSVTVTADANSSLPEVEGMRRIQPGTFHMGSNASSSLPYLSFSTERPVHAVRITRPFLIGIHEVTQAQYEEIMHSNPSIFQGQDRPVENVSWADAMAYCRALTDREVVAGRVPRCYEYRLPSEAEWEYCCRAGSVTEYNRGGVISCDMANMQEDRHKEFDCARSATMTVGRFHPNDWGLYDMMGNVAEMTADAGRRVYSELPFAYPDPVGMSGATLVVRGGAFNLGSEYCRSAHRGFLFWPGTPAGNIGFRVVLAPRYRL